MNEWTKALHAYCEAHSTAPSAVLNELERETHLKTLAPQMLSGRLQGQLLRMLSLIFQPKAILEIGTFTGYAAISMAEGLPDGSVLHTIEVNEEMEYLIRKYIDKAGLSNKIQLHIGDAEAIVPSLAETFDMAFIDAGKRDYAKFYEMVLDKIRPGGLILADNVLWSGKVLEKSNDQDTNMLKDFNRMIQEDVRVENVLLPVRDGLVIIRKL
jgi:predicted O-methyltransferase YrrM